jgi:hypothetical protein
VLNFIRSHPRWGVRALWEPKSVYYLREDVSLTGLRAHLRSDWRPRPRTLAVLTAVCLVLLALLAVAQVVHAHPVQSDADHCPLCIAMHSVVPFVVMVAALVLVRIETVAPLPLAVNKIILYWYPTLFTRPPPTSC